MKVMYGILFGMRVLETMNEGLFFPETSPWCHEQVGDAAQNRLCLGPQCWNSCLGGGNSNICFIFTPKIGEDFHPFSRA